MVHIKTIQANTGAYFSFGISLLRWPFQKMAGDVKINLFEQDV